MKIHPFTSPTRNRICGLLFLLPITGYTQESRRTLAPVPDRVVLRLTPQPGDFHTPSIAIDPSNVQHLLVGFQAKTSAAYSSDGGAHWALSSEIPPVDYRFTGDTSVAFDHRGHAFVCFIAHDGPGPFKYWGHDPKRNAILILRSLDGGATWGPHPISVIEHAEARGIPFEDKPYLVADNHAASPFAGNLYVGWTQDGTKEALILLSRSTDGGLTWSAPVRISDQPGMPRDDNGTVEGFHGVVTPDGALHVVFSDTNHIVYAVSRDGGKSFSRNRLIVNTAPSHFVVQNAAEANGYPQIAMMTDGRGGRPRLYVAWSDYRNGDVDIFCISSVDGGRNWGSPVRVNTDPVHNAADQLFQWLAVDPSSGAVNVVFFDRRRDPANRSLEVVLGRSTDGARSFENYLLSDHSFDPIGGSIGEYTGLAAFAGRVFATWTEILPTTQVSGGRRSRPASAIQVGIADFRSMATIDTAR